MPAKTADSPAKAVTWDIAWMARGAKDFPDAATVPNRINLPTAPAANKETIIFSSETVETALPTRVSTSDWVGERGFVCVCGLARSKRLAREEREEIPFEKLVDIYAPHQLKEY